MFVKKTLSTLVNMSLNKKVLFVLAPVFIIFFFIVGLFTERVLSSQIIKNMEESLKVLVEDEARDIELHFKHLEAIGTKSAKMVQEWLKLRPNPPDKKAFNRKYKKINGALRTDVNAFPTDDISAAFLSNKTKINDEIRQIMSATEEPYDNYAKGVIPTVFTMWLITRHQLGRSYEKEWTLMIEPDHDFTQDVFYYIADPTHNPERKVKWTKPYYDSIWKQWMTSVVSPIYIDGNFLGVVGHDVVLDDIYADILNHKYYESGYGFIFDHKTNIIIHPQYLDLLLKSAEMGTSLDTSDLGNTELTQILTKIVNNSSSGQRLSYDQFVTDGEIQYIFAYQLDFLDWYFAIVTSQDDILKMLPQYRQNFLKSAMLACLVLLTIVIVTIWFSVIKPINRLKKTADKISAGELQKVVKIHRRDEVGELSRAFNEMTAKLKAKMDELCKLNNELDQRVIERTAELSKAKEIADNARITAEEATKAKSVFLSNMSHELRSPLTVILGYSEFMQMDKGLSCEQKESLKVINRSGDHLLSLINDVLEISKIESGKIERNISFFDLHSLFRDMEMMFDSTIEAKGLSFDVIGTSNLPKYVASDERKLRQVVINLLSNAAKYTTEGGITMKVSAEMGSDDLHRLAVEVSDTGVGIAEEELDKVFTSFEQTMSGKVQGRGTGLGLAISREYARMMGGDITMSSKLGHGSTFIFHCTIREQCESDLRNKDLKLQVIGLAQGQKIPRVLVAEDKKESRTLLVQLLKVLGIEVKEAVNGKEALQIFREWHPHFIWMDIRMPVMDGLETTRQIKKSDAGRSTIIVALTAHAMSEEKEMILESGCDDFVRKPYREEEIYGAMEKHLHLKYVYQEPGGGHVAANTEIDELQLEHLALLPVSLVRKLHKAVEKADHCQAIEVVEQITAHDTVLGDILKKNLERSNYDYLLKALEKVSK